MRSRMELSGSTTTKASISPGGDFSASPLHGLTSTGPTAPTRVEEIMIANPPAAESAEATNRRRVSIAFMSAS